MPFVGHVDTLTRTRSNRGMADAGQAFRSVLEPAAVWFSAEVRRRLDLDQGDDLVLTVESDDSLRLSRARQVIRKTQGRGPGSEYSKLKKWLDRRGR